jgi:NAD(P)-dependent dehydrogenase (short-subunit alcohol dehydrogenase family)
MQVYDVGQYQVQDQNKAARCRNSRNSTGWLSGTTGKEPAYCPILPCILSNIAAGSSSIHFEQLDISDPSSVKKFAETVKAKHGSAAILVNNAGQPSPNTYVKMDLCASDPLITPKTAYDLRRRIF